MSDTRTLLHAMALECPLLPNRTVALLYAGLVDLLLKQQDTPDLKEIMDIVGNGKEGSKAEYARFCAGLLVDIWRKDPAALRKVWLALGNDPWMAPLDALLASVAAVK